MSNGSVCVSLIVAVSENGVIGRRGEMPWHLSADLKRFKQLTMGHSIIMGRKTYESIGRLLPGRTTVVVSRQQDFAIPGATVVGDLDAAFALSVEDPEVFVIGGGEIYRMALPRAQRLYVTRVHTVINDGDTWFPEFADSFWKQVQSESGVADAKNSFDYTFETYERRNPANIDRSDPATAGLDCPG